jgi:purine-nucleoside phosphorylase
VNFDADDYARTQADFVALGQQALIYTIGFGNFLDHGNPTSAGEQLLNYAADIGDDGKIDTGTGLLNSDYFYAHDATALSQIFKTISDRISTRLTH